MCSFVALSYLTLSMVGMLSYAATGVGKRSKESFIKNWREKAWQTADKVQYVAEFTIPSDFGQPGAILIRNKHQAEFYLDAIALKMPSGCVYFPCHSFVHPHAKNPAARIFFSNKVGILRPN